jgi:hypothetical protein
MAASVGEVVYGIASSVLVRNVAANRAGLDALHQGNGQLLARVRGDRLYAVQEKPSSFKQLIVCRMTWR